MIRSLLALPVAALAAGVALAHPPAPVYVAPVPVFAPEHHHRHHSGYVPAPVPVYTLDNFAREFHPSEGHHKILIVHPVTGQPVEVCFTLPCGRLEELDVNRRSIRFDFGRHDVRIAFRSNGTVGVRGD